MSEDFYRAFENRYRGSREVIKSRLRVYLPFVNPLHRFYDDAKIVDLGCGRGEWLELLQEEGFNAQGVDLDDGMLAACRERGLKVQTDDAVSFLKKLPGSSQVVVSGFHIAEHIPFLDLQVLVQEALRVLKPGGLLILETPNPENIVTGTSNFYLDPTHQRPIPPQLLSFLPEYYGFRRVKTIRLQESVGLSSSQVFTLMDVLNGVSPDYAVVAQKTGDAEILAAINPALEAKYGLTLEKLAIRYDQQITATAKQFEARVPGAGTRTQQPEAKAKRAEIVAQQAETKAQQAQVVAQRSEARAQQIEVAVQKAEVRERLIEDFIRESCYEKDSFIMPITWFFRRNLKPNSKDVIAAYRYFLRREPENVPIILEHMQHKTIGKLIDSFKSSEEFRIRMKPNTLIQSEFKAKVKKWIQQFPLLEKLRKKLDFNRSLTIKQNRATTDVLLISAYSSHLTPRARQIYADLKVAIERHQKENR